jgi:hypothetical protein
MVEKTTGTKVGCFATRTVTLSASPNNIARTTSICMFCSHKIFKKN